MTACAKLWLALKVSGVIVWAGLIAFCVVQACRAFRRSRRSEGGKP